MEIAKEPAAAGTDRLTPYQRLVVAAAWLGLGFDLMDSLLFNFISPICIPDLLGLTPGSPEAKSATGLWTGVLSSVMLFGWATGGIVFGRLSDRVGRTRTVIMTMLLYSVGTAACALAPNLLVLGICRLVASLGIGGEWAAGAILVAETVPEKRRVALGSFLFTSAPAGVFFAIFLHTMFTSKITSVAQNPSLSWRLVMASSLIAALIALVLRSKLKEPESWTSRERAAPPPIAALFRPALLRRTLGGLTVATTALLMFWVTSAFLPMVASFWAYDVTPRPSGPALADLQASLVMRSMGLFNLGGLIGSLATAPIATRVGRRPLYLIYFGWSAFALGLAFGAPLSPDARILCIGLVGLSVYGVFASFQFYLPELFPIELRGTGAGFCLNTGRFITVLGPLAVGLAADRGIPPMDLMRWTAIVPVVGLVLLLSGLGVETRGRALSA